jgi:small conductance mechanosensitive channel
MFETSTQSLRQILVESSQKELERLAHGAPKIILGVLVLFFFYWLSRLAVRAIDRLGNKYSQIQDNHSFLKTISRWVILFLGLSLSLQIMGLASVANKILAGGGILAVALGFAFKDIGENLIAGLMLTFNRPFHIGDMIESGRHRGRVRSIQLRYTHVRSSEGQDIYIPSAQIIKDALINHTADGRRRPNFSIGIAYQEDLNKVIDLILYEIFQTPGVLLEPKPTVAISRFDDLWVTLQVSFWIDTAVLDLDYLATVNQVMNSVKETLVTHNIRLGSQSAQWREVHISGSLDGPS